ncbi:MAG: hypothetical protein ACLGHK_12025 [Alphaproteobacteria bacterium]
MQSSRLGLAVCVLFALPGCGKDGGVDRASAPDRAPGWQRVASVADRDRIARWPAPG